MPLPENLDEIRRSALEIGERSRRQWVRAILVFAVVEAIGWVGYVLLAWFDFPVSVLIGVATVVLYSMVFGWAAALKGQIDGCTLRVLKAIEAVAANGPGNRPEPGPGPGT